MWENVTFKDKVQISQETFTRPMAHTSQCLANLLYNHVPRQSSPNLSVFWQWIRKKHWRPLNTERLLMYAEYVPERLYSKLPASVLLFITASHHGLANYEMAYKCITSRRSWPMVALNNISTAYILRNRRKIRYLSSECENGWIKDLSTFQWLHR